MNLNEVDVIGVDVGYGMCKTAHTEFTTSLRDYGETKPTMSEGVVYYKGKYYAIGGDRVLMKSDRTEDDVTFVITLAAIAEELKIKSKTKANIVLSVGLPIDRCSGSNRTDLESYYKRFKDVEFNYEDIDYSITIEDVFVNAQCVAGVIDLISEKSIPGPSIVVDLGSRTMDILPIDEKGKPQPSKCISLNEGVNYCSLKCNEEIRRRFGEDILESQIKQVMLGKTDLLPPAYSIIVQDEIKKYIKRISDLLIEQKFNIKALPCIFMGGGASVIKNYGEELFPIAKYRLDIRANAIGYERMAKTLLKQKNVS